MDRVRNAFGFLLLVLAGAALLGGCGGEDKARLLRESQIHYNLARDGFMGNRLQEALFEYQKSIELNPEFAEAHNGIGLVYLALEKYNKAVEHFETALKYQPKFADALNNLGSAFSAQERFDKAIPYFERALEDILYPTPYLAEGNLGWALYRTGKKDEGIDHLKKAVLINPKFCWGYQNLGRIYSEEGRSEQAIGYFERYRERCQDRPEAHYWLGVEFDKAGRAEKARECYATCARLDSFGTMGDECRKLLGRTPSPAPPQAPQKNP